MTAGRRRAVAAGLAGLLSAGALGLATRTPPPSAGEPLPDVAFPARPRPPALVDDREAAIRMLLQRRGAAVRQRDRAAFLATIDPRNTDLRAAQAAMFDALAGVPLSSWSYDLTLLDGDDPGTAQRWAPRGVVLRYALAGFDARPATLPQGPVFARHDGQWLLSAEDPARQARDLWDFGPVVAIRGQRSLVLAHPDRAGLARELGAEADRAVPAVTAVWGPDWAQRVVVLVPRDAAELAAVAQTGADLSAYAAVQSSELGGAGTGDTTPVGDRVGVNPAVYTRAGAPGRQVVMTHEVTHIATRAATGPGLPQWLVEGFADEVGFRDSGLPVARVAADLAEQVRLGLVPTRLPADGDFRAGGPGLASVYEQAWLAARVLVREHGEAGLVRLYRAVGAGASLDEGLQLLGSSVEQLTIAWLRDVRALAAHR